MDTALSALKLYPALAHHFRYWFVNAFSDFPQTHSRCQNFPAKSTHFPRPIRIPGSTFETCVDARKRPIQQSNQIVFEIDFQLYVKIVLAAARFKRLSDLIRRSVTFESCPTAKTVICKDD